MTKHSKMSNDASSVLVNQLSKEQLQRYKSLFNLIDQDHDGKITNKDLKSTILNLGIEGIEDDSINEMIPKKAKEMNLNGFFKLMATKFANFSEPTEITEAFEAFGGEKGTKNKTTVDSGRLKRGLLEVGRGQGDYTMSGEELDEVMKDFGRENKLTGEKLFLVDKFVDAVTN
ncbi:DEKNAAC102999 [Brettanomyces naardenensis]|uniref:DEKNAAC102999 n=1 Tax=Brettanomyces naardenensis TaxID=13370 RepID=A0A448YM98_BRENA|nr:DEKNAAC102999 [Brettanomyces naardenensis]